jgi:hypothetical protein
MILRMDYNTAAAAGVKYLQPVGGQFPRHASGGQAVTQRRHSVVAGASRHNAEKRRWQACFQSCMPVAGAFFDSQKGRN